MATFECNGNPTVKIGPYTFTDLQGPNGTDGIAEIYKDSKEVPKAQFDQWVTRKYGFSIDKNIPIDQSSYACSISRLFGSLEQARIAAAQVDNEDVLLTLAQNLDISKSQTIEVGGITFDLPSDEKEKIIAKISKTYQKELNATLEKAKENDEIPFAALANLDTAQKIGLITEAEVSKILDQFNLEDLGKKTAPRGDIEFYTRGLVGRASEQLMRLEVKLLVIKNENKLEDYKGSTLYQLTLISLYDPSLKTEVDAFLNRFYPDNSSDFPFDKTAEHAIIGGLIKRKDYLTAAAVLRKWHEEKSLSIGQLASLATKVREATEADENLHEFISVASSFNDHFTNSSAPERLEAIALAIQTLTVFPQNTNLNPEEPKAKTDYSHNGEIRRHLHFQAVKYLLKINDPKQAKYALERLKESGMRVNSESIRKTVEYLVTLYRKEDNPQRLEQLQKDIKQSSILNSTDKQKLLSYSRR